MYFRRGRNSNTKDRGPRWQAPARWFRNCGASPLRPVPPRSGAPPTSRARTRPRGRRGCAGGTLNHAGRDLRTGFPNHRLVKLLGVEVFHEDEGGRLQLQGHRQGPRFRAPPATGFRNVLGLHPPPASDRFVAHFLAFIEGFEPAARYARVVYEEVFAPVIRGDEAEALLAVEPLDRPLGHLPSPPFCSWAPAQRSAAPTLRWGDASSS